MRMWNINPTLMCRSHLVAEHRELHMIAGTMNSTKGPSGNYIRGLVNNGLLEPEAVKERHDELAAEIAARGYKHRTPMADNPKLPDVRGTVCPGVSAYELRRRCLGCRELIPMEHVNWELAQQGCREDDDCLDRMARDFYQRPTDPRTGVAVQPES